MTTLHASAALLPNGWANAVTIVLDGSRIASVTPDSAPSSTAEHHRVIVPAISNVHSHAFQRAMSGLAERGGPDTDNFWSWRTIMYKFALTINPDQVEAIAAQLYVEMLEAGFARVGEFHYLHHDPVGAHYANIAEMAERIAQASVETGLGLTLLPVFYAHGNFGARAPSQGQRRFLNTPDQYAALVEKCRSLLGGVPGALLGIAPHSLRAATLSEITTILPLAAAGPVHIHIAEQEREVDDCMAAHGVRPVQLLLDNVPLDAHWCLIHATHLNAGEAAGIARSGAVVGLCPITEANLGDGIFPGANFHDQGGYWGIGSDSNVRISLREELRQYEYGQRLANRARNIIAHPGASTGQILHQMATTGGGRALGHETGIAADRPADLVALNVDAVDYLPAKGQLDSWIFGHDVSVDDVWALGRKQVRGGRHVKRDAIRQRFERTMADLLRT